MNSESIEQSGAEVVAKNQLRPAVRLEGMQSKRWCWRLAASIVLVVLSCATDVYRSVVVDGGFTHSAVRGHIVGVA